MTTPVPFHLSSLPPAGTLPNILLLVTDQFRHDAFNEVITPNLWRAAFGDEEEDDNNEEESSSSPWLYFENAYSSTPTCTPARAALLTGKSSWAHGMLGYGTYTNCDKYPTTLPKMLSKFHNYTTVAIGKNHFGPKKHVQGYQKIWLYDGVPKNGQPDDYDEWFYKHHHHHHHHHHSNSNDTATSNDDPPLCKGTTWNGWKAHPYCYDTYFHPTEWTTRQALEYLQNYTTSLKTSTTTSSMEESKSQQSNSSPLFIKVSYHRPHSPYDPPRDVWEDLIHNITTTKMSTNANNSNISKLLHRILNDTSWDRKYKPYNISSKIEAYAGDPGEDESFKSRTAYLANAWLVDRGIGRLFDHLKKNDLYDNFMIVWTADHGDMNGDHYLWRKGYPWEASSHIPLLIKLPTTTTTAAMKTKTTTTKSQKKQKQQAQERRQSSLRIPQKFHQQKRKLLSRNNHYYPQSSKALVELRDVAPTIYDAVGILSQVQTLDSLMDGKSLMPLLLDSTSYDGSVRKNHNATNNNSSNKNEYAEDDKDDDGSLSFRRSLSLEHSLVYGEFYWNALIGYDRINDGNDKDSPLLLFKYVFNVIDGTEQLFCLTDDPNEWYDLANVESTSSSTSDINDDKNEITMTTASYKQHKQQRESLLKKWRQRLVDQFIDEGRDERWVKNGKLQRRNQSIIFGRNYPCRSSKMEGKIG